MLSALIHTRRGYPAVHLAAQPANRRIWFNHEYILMKSDDEIANLFAPIVANNGVEETLDRVKQVVELIIVKRGIVESVGYLDAVLHEGYWLEGDVLVNLLHHKL